MLSRTPMKSSKLTVMKTCQHSLTVIYLLLLDGWRHCKVTFWHDDQLPLANERLQFVNCGTGKGLQLPSLVCTCQWESAETQWHTRIRSHNNVFQLLQRGASGDWQFARQTYNTLHIKYSKQCIIFVHYCSHPTCLKLQCYGATYMFVFLFVITVIRTLTLFYELLGRMLTNYNNIP